MESFNLVNPTKSVSDLQKVSILWDCPFYRDVRKESFDCICNGKIKKKKMNKCDLLNFMCSYSSVVFPIFHCLVITGYVHLH